MNLRRGRVNRIKTYGVQAVTGDAVGGPPASGTPGGVIEIIIPADTIDFARMQNITPERLIGLGEWDEDSDPREIAVGQGLEFDDQTLQVTDELFDAVADLAALEARVDAAEAAISTLQTDLTALTARVAALEAATGGGGAHVHGVFRVLGDGSTVTFDLPDLAEYLEFAAVDGLFIDPTTYTLSADRSQITFTAAPGASKVVQVNYVIANL